MHCRPPASGSSDSENSRTTFIIKRWLDHRKIQIFQERRIRIFDRRFPLDYHNINTTAIDVMSTSSRHSRTDAYYMDILRQQFGQFASIFFPRMGFVQQGCRPDKHPTIVSASAHRNACKRGIKRHTGKTAPPVRQSVIRIRNQKEQPGSRLTGIGSLQHNQPARHRRESGPNLVIPTLQTIFVSSLERNLGLNDRRIRASVTKRDRIPFGNDPSGIQHLVIIEPLIHMGLRYTSQIRFESSFHLGKHKF